jgi:hypothetical protein
MLEIVKNVAAVVATCTEFIAVLVIVAGATQALWAGVMPVVRNKTRIDPNVVFRGFAGWLVLRLSSCWQPIS